jgi:hypothetical protein
VSRVRIGTCSGPADAAFVRSVFAARGIAVVVGAEHHSGMLAGLGGGFLSLDIWVDEADSEEAQALLRDLRDGDACVTDDDVGELAADQTDGPIDGSGSDHTHGTPDDVDHAIDTTFHHRLDRRRRTGIALLLGCCITFGTAHMFTGAWSRGIALAALELIGILRVGGGHPLGSLAIAAAVAFDLIGAISRIWSASDRALPVARLRRRN